MRQVTEMLLLWAFMHGVNCLCVENTEQRVPSREDIRVIYAPSDPSQAFADFKGDENTPAINFIAQDSRLKEIYIWIHEPLSGPVGAQILHGGFSGPVIATGFISGKDKGKQIRVSNAPTLFGKIDYQIFSDIDNGNVYVTLSMPEQANSASQILLRLRTPGNKKIKKVNINSLYVFV